MAQISIDTFNSECVTFVVDVEDVFSWKYHIQISTVPISAIVF